MKLKISLKWSLLVVSIATIASSSIIIFFLTSVPSSEGSYARLNPPGGNQSSQNLEQAGSNLNSESSAGQRKAGLPIRLKIPKINVDAPIQDVGLTPQGAMDAPTGPTNTAWFDLGPRPGENGSAVIAGHEGWKDGISAIFDDLHTLGKGDKVYVEDENGAVATFVVREVRMYSQNENASEVFSSSNHQAHLNLVTCDGPWNNDEKSYSDRLVVFTDEE